MRPRSARASRMRWPAAQPAQRLGERLGAEGVGDQVGVQMIRRQGLGGRRPDRGEPEPAQGPEVAAQVLEPLEEEADAVGRREDQPVELLEPADRRIQRSPGRRSAGPRPSAPGGPRHPSPRGSPPIAHASAAGRVTTIRWPNSGKCSYQCELGREVPRPRRRSGGQGGPRPPRGPVRVASPSVAARVRCEGRVPDSTIAAGVSAGFPSRINVRQIEPRWVTPM